MTSSATYVKFLDKSVLRSQLGGYHHGLYHHAGRIRLLERALQEAVWRSGDQRRLRAAGPTVLVCGHNVGTESFEIASTGALHKKSWAVIDRPYSLGCATVGALYERPRCIFCAKPLNRLRPCLIGV